MKTVNLKIGTDTFQTEGGKTETRDEYPWGLRFTLNNDTLEKLGFNEDNLPKVGDMLQVFGLAKVLSVSTRTEGNDQESSVDLQFTDIGVTPAKRDSSQELKAAFYPDRDAGGE